MRAHIFIGRVGCGEPAMILHNATHAEMMIFVDEDNSYESLDEAVLTLFNLGIGIRRVRSGEGCLDVLAAPNTDPELMNALNKNGVLGEFHSICITTEERIYHAGLHE